MYGVLPGIWYFAPGSKSASDLGTGGAIPWYLHLECTNTWLFNHIHRLKVNLQYCIVYLTVQL